MSLSKISALRPSTSQTFAYTATSATVTNGFSPQTYCIRVSANSACHFKVVDGSGAATTNDVYLPANWVDYVVVTPGQKVSAIRASTGGLVTATDGTFYVTEMT